MSRKSQREKASKVISYVLLLFITIAAFGFFAFFSNNFTTDLKTFYIRHNDELILGNKSNFVIIPNTEYVFYPQNALGFLSKEPINYTVDILPATDFDYEVDGKVYAFSAIGQDYLSVFNVIVNDDHFTVDIDTDMQGLLSRLHGGQDVVLPRLESKDYFLLVVTSGDVSIKISFSMYVTVTNIELDRDSVII